MNNARLKMGLSGLSVPAFLVKCRKVVTNLTDNNVLFPNPAPPLALVTTTIDELDDLQERMGTEGGTNNTILRNLAQEQVMVQMRLLATYVSNVAQGNADIILKSGFGIHDSAEKTEDKLPPPTEVVVTCDGLNFGELMVRWAGVPGNTGYTISIAEIVNGQAAAVAQREACEAQASLQRAGKRHAVWDPLGHAQLAGHRHMEPGHRLSSAVMRAHGCHATKAPRPENIRSGVFFFGVGYYEARTELGLTSRPL
jgi:hypothetical protein